MGILFGIGMFIVVSIMMFLFYIFLLLADMPRDMVYNEDGYEEIQKLTKEIVQYRYCFHVLHFDIMTINAANKKIKMLENLEKRFPQFKKWYSPTTYYGYYENKAREVFYSDVDWEEFKRTMSFVKGCYESLLYSSW